MKKKKQKRPAQTTKAPGGQAVPPPVDSGSNFSTFPVVAIGASAGGIEAFADLLSHLPNDTGMGFVLIQHLAPDRESLLTSILARTCSLTVVTAEDGMLVRPNHVYVMPPNVLMGLRSRRLTLAPRVESPGRNMPINFFMRSLADDQRAAAIGIVLSGADSDGAEGLRAINAQGGLTMVQDPVTAKIPSMPRNAIASGATDTVLGIAGLARELVRIGNHPLARAGASEDLEGEAEAFDLKRVIRLLKQGSGVDFSTYRKGTVVRRLRRRVLLKGAASVSDYLKRLETDPDELMDLYDDMLINVTSFFRDPGVFEIIKQTVLPKILKRSTQEGAFRMWVAGCATGEEVYSYAILLHEVMESLGRRTDVQIFASDLSERALEVAREGYYLDSVVTDISEERLRKFFTKVAGGYCVNPTIRERCIFARHDLTRDPPFSRMDLVSCRNLLIYLEVDQQHRVLNNLSYALNSVGYLVLGASETATSSEAFDLVDRESKIYLRKPIRPRPSVQIQLGTAVRPRTSSRSAPKMHDDLGDLERLVAQHLLQRFAPSGVVVTDSMQIVLFQGSTGEYLEPASGEASLNVLKMARPGLDTELRMLLRTSEKSGKLARKDDLRLRDGARRFAVEVVPLRLGEESRFYLIVFLPEREPASSLPPPQPTGDAISDALRSELESTRDYLQSIINEKEVGNEELQAANEEIVSSNEELQSTNEELETAKEELQSTNEELTTVNDELSMRNHLLAETNNDLNNLLASVNLPIMMVGSDLRIRRFTPQIERVFRVINSDVGRPVTDIMLNINLPEIGSLIREVVDRGQMIERVVEDRVNQRYSLRIRPYRTVNDRIDGAVLVLVDLSGEEAQPRPVGQPGDWDAVDQPVVFLDQSFVIISGNLAAQRSFQMDEAALVGADFFEILGGAWNHPMLKSLLAGVLTKKEVLENFRVHQHFGETGARVFAVSARRTIVKAASAIMIVLDELSS